MGLVERAVSGPSEGTVIAGRYRLEKMIGEGGMARIWSGRDLTLDRPVAVKFLFLREDRDRQTMIDRFLREARIAAAIRHPNVVDILDFGTSDDGRPFMVMELLVGESLEDRIMREPPLTIQELVRIACEALDGLASVHKAGIVHRDLKPDNLFLFDRDGDERVKLLDFGVSRDTDSASGRRSALTTTDGYLVGTPEYMAPEQARGLKDIDWRADIYAMGVILYEILTGDLPYQAEAVGDMIIEIVQGGAPTVATLRPEAGEAISAVVEKAMSVPRDARHQSAREMKDALVRAAEESLGTDVRPSLPMIAPARMMAANEPARKLQSKAGTLDGDDLALPWGPGAVPGLGAGPGLSAVPTGFDDDDLPWGAGAVPGVSGGTLAAELDDSFDDALELGGGKSEPGRTPQSWVVDTTLPKRAARWPWVALAVVIPLAGLGTWLALRAPSPEPVHASAQQPADEPADEPPEVAPPVVPEARVTEPVAPEPSPPTPVAPPEPPSEVTVRLHGLASDAEVRVDDGEPVALEEGTLRVPRDGADHTIAASAPGRRTWRATHRADQDGDYRVEMPREHGSSRHGRRGGSEHEEASGGGGEGAGGEAGSGGGGDSNGVFRDLDY